mmetsp:Transcript_72755/g.137569  ORF Transcript_72755/g.137569 Transcript_72755/m.137569 type:complete len:96 (-) Transcript_72755:123-410(-)
MKKIVNVDQVYFGGCRRFSLHFRLFFQRSPQLNREINIFVPWQQSRSYSFAGEPFGSCNATSPRNCIDFHVEQLQLSGKSLGPVIWKKDGSSCGL